MADPQHVPELDGFDRFTVRAYRSGLVAAAVGLAGQAAAHGAGAPAGWAEAAVTVGVALCAGNLHLYDKRVRWVIGWLAWAGLLARLGGAATGAPILAALGEGLLLASLAGVVLKEWFCFRLPLVRWTPLVLAAAVLGAFAGLGVVAAVAYALGALGVGAVGVAKLRMPLGHDVGDRSRYQV